MFTDNFMPTIGVDFVSNHFKLTSWRRKSEPSKLRERPSSSKSGTPLAKNALRPSLPHTTKERTVSSSLTTLQTVSHSLQSSPGWEKSRSTPLTTFPASSLATSPTWRTSDRSPLKKARSLLSTITSDSWRLQPRIARTLTKLSS